MNDSEVLIKVDGVSKKFCRSLKLSLLYGVSDTLSDLNPLNRISKTGDESGERSRRLRKNEFFAVDNVSFELRRGECLGLIGRNGAGKTTLLKMLNGLIKPDTGRIEMRGRVGALIALGAGFNPILTGRENIYVNGSILGLSKSEIDNRIEEIIDFSEVREFIDSPVQSYSSGMQVRLGFAVATALDPDVLILDEVLAVGDANFRAKCYNRIGKMLKTSAVIFVSHNEQQVAQICTSVLALSRGKVQSLGSVVHGLEAYSQDNTLSSSKDEKTCILEPPITKASIKLDKRQLHFGDRLKITFNSTLDHELKNCSIRIPFYNNAGQVVMEWNSRNFDVEIDLSKGNNSIEIELQQIYLKPGSYDLGLVLNDSTGVIMPFWSLREYCIKVIGVQSGSTEYQISHYSMTLS